MEPRSSVLDPARELPSGAAKVSPTRVTWRRRPFPTARFVLPIVPPVIAVVAWWVAGNVMGGLKGEILTPPPEIVAAVWDLVRLRETWTDFAATAKEFAIAFVIAYSFGVVVGLLISSSRLLTAIIEPYVLAAYSVPKIAFLPILLAIMGLGQKMVIAFGVIHAVLPVLLAAMGSVRQLDPMHKEVAAILNASRLQTYTKVVLPGVSLPIIAAARLCFTMCCLTVVTAEIIASDKGMGFRVMKYYTAFDYPSMYAAICLTVTLCAAAYVITGLLERPFLKGVGKK